MCSCCSAASARPQLPGLFAPKFRVTDTGMPEGLEAGMSVQDMADLLTFIEELK